jgi:hypothetical protein
MSGTGSVVRGEEVWADTRQNLGQTVWVCPCLDPEDGD